MGVERFSLKISAQLEKVARMEPDFEDTEFPYWLKVISLLSSLGISFFFNFFFSSSAPQRAAVWSTANGSLFSLDPRLHFRYNRYISFGCYFYEFCVHTSDLVSIIIETRC